MTPFAEILDGGALLQVVWVSFAAGIGLTLAFSLAIASLARAGQHRRGGSAGAAVGWSLIAVGCTAVCAVAVAFSVITMLSK